MKVCIIQMLHHVQNIILTIEIRYQDQKSQITKTKQNFSGLAPT